MEKEKKNSNTGVIIVLAILLIAVIAFGIWAWSKYTSTLTGNATATVAKWNFTLGTSLNDLDLAITSSEKGTMFDEVNNVVTDKIAPGTSGSFDVVLDTSTTEVALDYVIDITGMTTKPKNLHFYKDASHTTAIDTETGAQYTGSIAKGDHANTHTITIYWAWPYETKTEPTLKAEEKSKYGILDSDTALVKNDKIDTYDGENATTKGVKFDITITGTQVDPSENEVTTHQN